ncbi:MAG: ABC transporter ATP-binding protein [Elusimicrobia bacterium]|nr:ABC transporter ATP-binding protein [Elusimicrobiota bacterium]
MIKAIRFVFPYWVRYKGRMTLIVSLGVMAAAAHIVMPLVMRHLIDGLKAGFTYALIMRDAAIIMAAGVSLALVNLFAIRNRAWMNLRLEWEIRQMVFEHLVRLDRGFYHRYPTGDLVTRLVDDVQEKLSWFACSGVFRAVQSGVTFMAALAAMLWLKPGLALWAVSPLPFLLVFHVKVRRLISERFAEVQKAISAIFSFLEACFSGIRVVKANRKEASQDQAFAVKAVAQRDAEVAAARVHAAFGAFFHNGGLLGVVLVFLAGGLQVMEGRITIGDLVAFQFFASMLVWPVFDMGNFVVAGRRAGVCVGRIEEILDATTTVVEPCPPAALPPGPLSLEFSGVSYRAVAEGPSLLKDVSFAARPGMRVAVVGKLGSGKSLLMALIPRLVDVSAGRVLAGDSDIRELGLAEWRSRIGFVPQEPVIFSGTLRENVALGREGLCDGDVKAAFAAAQMASEIASFPKGIDTVVGPRGLTLSGGQKARVAVARAIVTRPPILLLDDCTSAMDADTEDRLWEALATSLPGSLQVFITHRPKTVASADLILTLDNGVVVQTGTHQELMRAGGLYKEIYQRVQLEMELRGTIGGP